LFEDGILLTRDNKTAGYILLSKIMLIEPSKKYEGGMHIEYRKGRGRGHYEIISLDKAHLETRLFIIEQAITKFDGRVGICKISKESRQRQRRASEGTILTPKYSSLRKPGSTPARLSVKDIIDSKWDPRATSLSNLTQGDSKDDAVSQKSNEDKFELKNGEKSFSCVASSANAHSGTRKNYFENN